MSGREEQLEEVKARLRLRIPGLKKSIGAGDVVRKATEALGIEHCSECDQRRERLNRFLEFEAYLEEEETQEEEPERDWGGGLGDSDVDGYSSVTGGRGWD